MSGRSYCRVRSNARQSSWSERHARLDLAGRIAEGEFTFVTNNRLDFLRLFGKMDLHAGLFVLVQSVVPSRQQDLFAAALQFLAGREMVNSVIEVNLVRQAAQCVEYSLPGKLSP